MFFSQDHDGDGDVVELEQLRLQRFVDGPGRGLDGRALRDEQPQPVAGVKRRLVVQRPGLPGLRQRRPSGHGCWGADEVVSRCSRTATAVTATSTSARSTPRRHRDRRSGHAREPHRAGSGSPGTSPGTSTGWPWAIRRSARSQAARSSWPPARYGYDDDWPPDADPQGVAMGSNLTGGSSGGPWIISVRPSRTGRRWRQQLHQRPQRLEVEHRARGDGLAVLRLSPDGDLQLPERHGALPVTGVGRAAIVQRERPRPGPLSFVRGSSVTSRFSAGYSTIWRRCSVEFRQVPSAMYCGDSSFDGIGLEAALTDEAVQPRLAPGQIQSLEPRRESRDGDTEAPAAEDECAMLEQRREVGGERGARNACTEGRRRPETPGSLRSPDFPRPRRRVSRERRASGREVTERGRVVGERRLDEVRMGIGAVEEISRSDVHGDVTAATVGSTSGGGAKRLETWRSTRR